MNQLNHFFYLIHSDLESNCRLDDGVLAEIGNLKKEGTVLPWVDRLHRAEGGRYKYYITCSSSMQKPLYTYRQCISIHCSPKIDWNYQKMVGEWYDSDRTLKGAVTLTGVSFFVFMAAFFSPYWLQSVPSEKLPEPKFTNLGKLLLKSLCCLVLLWVQIVLVGYKMFWLGTNYEKLVQKSLIWTWPKWFGPNQNDLDMTKTFCPRPK